MPGGSCPAEHCLCILSSSLTPAGECQPGWPARACAPSNYKGCSLRPDLFSPLILPTTALRSGGLDLLSLYPFDGPGN